LPKAWLQDRKRDYYYKKAKEEKYRTRAAYKLLQTIQKYHFIKKGDLVIDLGAAPGGWLQAARKTVGTEGLVVGIDLKEVEPFPFRNVIMLIGDINDEDTKARILEILPRKANAVISDASPNISGIWEVDHASQIDLALHSLNIALDTLESSGSLFIKVFQGDMLNDFVSKVKKHFEVVRVIKPKASRAKSSEIFVLGMRMKRAGA
jgi:23S rRNA (uridine2552-2'-O)-methyltransferase